MATSRRIRCLVPFCKCTRHPEFDEDEEWICNKHFAAIPRPQRVEYEAAWREADKADKRAAEGMEVSDAVYVRVVNAWEACKAAALSSL